MLRSLASKYEESLFGSILPFWLNHSLDREFGGYFSCLDREGKVYDSRKYIWMNGRQVWTFARLYNEVAPRAEWLEAARLGAEFLRQHAFDEQGRCWFSVTREGVPAAYQRKPYAAFFVALGFLEYAKASGENAYREKAVEIYEKLALWMTDATQLGRPSIPGAPRLGQLADIYVMCAMALELDDRSMLAQCLRNIERHFTRRDSLLLEMAPLDSGSAAYPEARMICVGSIFEISWYLLRALDRLPDPLLEARLLRCVEGALEFGWDAEFGGFYYFQDLDGRPPVQLEANMKLWWVHAEALYCLIAVYARTKNPKWLDALARVDEWVWRRFPDPDFGEWFGYLDRRGDPALLSKGGPYKGCFHIPRALLFSVQAIEQLKLKPER